MNVDHFMYAVASLEEGMDWAEKTFGVQPIHGGAHQGLGTQNALLAFDGSYLEIIAPDPDQDLSGTMGERLATLKTGGLVTWAAEGNLADAKEKLTAKGITSRGPVETRRRQPNGKMLTWELLFPTSNLYGMPFFIDWMACEHPSRTSPRGGIVRGFSIETPEEAVLKNLFSCIDLDVNVISGNSNLRLEVETSKGSATLVASEETRGLMVN